MKINWKVRIVNPVWWIQVAFALIVPVLSYFGYGFENMTSWEIVWQTFLKAVQNPYVIGIVLVSVFNTINDPTTKGISDSEQALKYTRPK